ncbi:OmpA family protein [Alphaproteobacteria bacterium GH1-50]|uniref:OmpA family protein n=1 Tax=Kangsaoukella pontilimi TaxID=2691042 RepID=A0A7C9J3P2_9RHOB|nr:OmpA family protein [Kangsaoukella pontilimi]MXQ08321.1 OmpA family protein [Kangsaoukella pontilimi]
MTRIFTSFSLIFLLGAVPAPVTASDAPMLDRVLAILPGGASLEGFDTVYFDFDRDFLDPSAREQLDQQAAYIRSRPNLKFGVTGHTDMVGNLTYNRDLGMRRAKRVVAYLVSKGIESERLVAMVSFGEEKPAVRTEDRERLNRRVITEVMGRMDRKIVQPRPAPGKGSTSSAAILPDTDTDAPRVTAVSQDPEPTAPTKTNGKGSRMNAGGGNGDEAGDPGKSEGKNRGKDENSF